MKNTIKKRLLKLREKMKRKRPKFRRREWFKHRPLGESWRRPRGIHSKVRIKQKSKGALVEIGYRTPRAVRGLHPSGYEEVLIKNPNELTKVDVKKQAVRISSSVGKRKRQLILQKAAEMKLKVLN